MDSSQSSGAMSQPDDLPQPKGPDFIPPPDVFGGYAAGNGYYAPQHVGLSEHHSSWASVPSQRLLAPGSAHQEGQRAGRSRTPVVVVAALVFPLVIALLVWGPWRTGGPPVEDSPSPVSTAEENTQTTQTTESATPVGTPVPTGPPQPGTVIVIGGIDQPFTSVPNLTSVVALATESNALFAIVSDGSLWAMGDNSRGQLGLGSQQGADVPTRVKSLADVTEVVATTYSGYALTKDGAVWTWGQNLPTAFGNMWQSSPTPVRVMGLPPIAHITGAVDSVYAVDASGMVWAWGRGTYPLFDHSEVDYRVPRQLPGIDRVTAISAHREAAMALRADGTVWTWGTASFGELGTGSNERGTLPAQVPGLTAVTAIAKSPMADYALQADGTLWAWGYNLLGQCGTGERPVHSSDSGAIYRTPVQVPGLADVVRVESHDRMVYAWTADGLYVWGSGPVAGLMDVPDVPDFGGVVAPTLLTAFPPVASVVDSAYTKTYAIVGGS